MTSPSEQMQSRRSLIQLGQHLNAIVRQRLWLQVLIAMALGIAGGVVMGPSTGWVSEGIADVVGAWIALPGRLFLASIQFIVVPLVVASVIRGIAAGDTAGELRKIGTLSVAYFIGTTVLAVAIGLACAGLIRPGQFLKRGMLAATEDAPLVTQGPAELPKLGEMPDIIVGLLPNDPLTAFVGGNMLDIVIAAIIIGVALLITPGDQRRPLLDLLGSVQAVCMVIVGYVLRFAPLAVFGLLANISMQVGLSALIGLAAYVGVVLLALALLLMTYVATAMIIGGGSPRVFLAKIREVMLLAFSTSSSAAVMPLTLTTCENKLHVRNAVARFVIPLGTTINMGGTALYQGVATLFLAQVFGIEIGPSGLLLVVILATSAAIGSPGTPGVGIVVLSTILASVGVPPAGIAIILGVDRILDMARTVVNVTGDIVACLVVSRILGGAYWEPIRHHAPVPEPGMPTRN